MVWLPLAVASLALLCGGCGFLKPSNNPVRHFVLAPVAATNAAVVPHGAPTLGIGQVKVSAYLNNTSFAMRKGATEIEYLPLVVWAGRLDHGMQRVLAANLAALVPTDHVRLSAWPPAEVKVEVYVTIERFDVSATGGAELRAWWRLLAPGGETLLKSGRSHLARYGPPPEADPAGAVNTLSDLFGEFSRELAAAIKSLGSQ